jgi:molybdopterin adenylyltransferase
MLYSVGIITLSDKGSEGIREDMSGPKIKELLPKDKYEVVSYKLLPDDEQMLKSELTRLCDEVMQSCPNNRRDRFFKKRYNT